jgi:hypothetical protein
MAVDSVPAIVRLRRAQPARDQFPAKLTFFSILVYFIN